MYDWSEMGDYLVLNSPYSVGAIDHLIELSNAGDERSQRQLIRYLESMDIDKRNFISRPVYSEGA